VPKIVTKRLILRGFAREDAPDVFAYSSDPVVLRYTTGRPPRSVRDSQEFVDGLMRKPPGAYAWALTLRSESCVIGAVEFGVKDGLGGSIHYALGRQYWNRGLMTEACRAVLGWAFRSHPGLAGVTTSAIVANRASRRIMEKCGMQFQRTIREKWEKFPHPVELAVYSIDRERWESDQQRAAEESCP
jgi:ribosomal-protein-alanine N-acetyltransferase